MLSQAYMQNAFLVGACVAVVAGVVGFFVVLRGASFAAHSLAQIGFAGAAGAVLIGADPMLGLLAFSVGGSGAMGVLGARESRRDASTALVMTAALGIGALFLVLNRSYATDAFSLLFGTIVGISRAQVYETALLTAFSVLAVALMFRPLLFSTVNDDAARARGLPLRLMNAAFLICVALAVTVSIPTTGTLLIFAMIVAPPAAAALLADRPASAMALGIVFNLIVSWSGIALAYATGLPVGFLIATLAAAMYVGARGYAHVRVARARAALTPM